MTPPGDPSTPKRYGLIAGWGNYPVLIASALKKEGHRVFCLGVAGHADSGRLKPVCDEYRECGLGRFGSAIRFFRKHGIAEATMAGKIIKKVLLRPGLVWRHFPDPYTFLSFFPLFLSRKTDLKDDTLLLAAVKAFEKKGVRLIPATSLVPNLLVSRGTLTRRRLTESDHEDIRAAWPLTREIGRLDFGQAVMVRNRMICAIEGIDGTDDTISRAGKINRGKPFTVVKIAKPNQDMRFDVPAVGLRTLERMARSGSDVLVIEADKTLCVDPLTDFVARADELGIAVAALCERDIKAEPAGEPAQGGDSFSCLTQSRPTPPAAKDVRFGLPVIRSLRRFGVGKTVTVRERSVIAVQSETESRLETLRRSNELAPDGFAILFTGQTDEKERACLDESLIRRAAETGGRVIAADPGFLPDEIRPLIRFADQCGIPIVKFDSGAEQTCRRMR